MTADPRDAARGGQEADLDRYHSIIEAVQDGVFVVDLDGTITYINDSLCRLTGRDREELLGATFETLAESALVGSTAYNRFVTAIETLADGDVQEQRLTFDIAGTGERVVEVRVSKHRRDGGTEDIVGVVRDVTDRERRARAAEQKQKALASLYEVGADASLTFEGKAERILAIGCEFLDLPYGFLTRVDEDVQQIVHAVGDHELIQPDESAPIEKSYCRRTIRSDDLVGIQNAETELGANDPAYELFELGCYIGTKVLVGETLYGTFCFAAPHDRDREFTSGEREVVKLLGQWSGYELERQRFEARLEGLHQISQRLLVAETTADVAETTVRMGADLFGLPVTACWEYDSGDDVLRPLAETDEALRTIGETPTFERGEGLVWESFDSGEIRSYGDVTERSAVYNPGTEVRSEVHVPIGTHGIITSATTGSQAFDEVDVESLRLLGVLTEEAMTAVKREERLAERGEALQRQNERLEEFAHVVAHDLRNPLAGAMGSLEVARETNDQKFFELAAQSLDRMEDLIGELLDIARGDRREFTEQTLQLRSTVDEAWSYMDAREATLSVAGSPGDIRADETRLLQLFSNLFNNGVEHGGDDVTVEVGLLAADEGFYVADDGPGLSEQTRTAIRDFGEGEGLSELGIGLMSIVDVVEEHGWELSVPDTDGGARFEIRTGC